ncbi:WD repeat-containing protein 6 [Anastrepha obliqua]|uniref:WD repeat-containing protein 6 n=1 Tax=Anastrepha obliqua TaxID=95512 RepID=UPI00240A949D|nr:WD repeat-containing protein 6 [Anastrepha obliqua]
METELTIADSIAIKLLRGGALITGVGNELHLHTPKTSERLVLSQRLRAKVHGIVDMPMKIACRDQGRLIVHGEKECLLLQYDCIEEKYTFKELWHFQLTDWISSAGFLQDPNEFILLTSHSVVLHILYDENAEKGGVCKVVAKSSSNDKSTLYCSRIHGKTLEELVIFGGNAFGELLIWKPFSGDNISNNIDCTQFQVDLKRRQPAHNGVIFSIDFDDAFGLLTTTSDDRSIRFWKLEKPSTDDWNKFNLNAIASGYGHVARVFQGKIIHCCGQQFAVTVAEDSHVCVWKSNAELVFKKRVQFGAVIWNFEYDQHTHTLYTVGSTGNLFTLNLKNVIQEANQSSTTTVLTDLEPKEYVAKAKFLQFDMLVGVTNKSRLMYTSLKSNEENDGLECGAWQVLEMNKLFKCTVLEVYDNYIALCGYKKLAFFKYCQQGIFEKLFDGDIMDGVIRAFHFLSNSTFLISDETGKCLLLEGESLQLRIAVPLPHCKEPWTTTALRIQAQEKKEFLVISNRMGNILLFNLEVATASCILTSTLRQLHGALGATMLCVQEVCNEEVFIQSAGHDGSLRLLSIEIKSGTITSHQRTPVPVAWVEHLIAMENSEFLLGFNDNHFVVWSQQHDFSVQVPCGGGHRSWHYNITTDVHSTTFLQLLFIKNKALRLHKLKLFNNPATSLKVFQNRWHTRSCNVLELVEAANHGEPHPILISAGDDNIVKISKLMPRGRLVQCAEVHSHISNVRALKVLQVYADQVLIFSGGGRAQLCITRLNLKSFRIQELVSYTLNKSGQMKGQINCYRPDPETRIMACDVVKANTENSGVDMGYLIFLCCSDGYLRRVLVNSSFQVVSEHSAYYGCCLLQVRAIANSYLIIAGTDGNLRFFDLDLTEFPIQLSHHASGVNAMDILFEVGSNILHILTGGDDQSVSYSCLQLQDAKSFKIKNKFHLANAHSAQVTAVQLSSDGKTVCAYTSGLDQTIKMVDIQTQEVELICYTCVSDIKGLVVDDCKRCFVYGCGIQIFKLKK